MKYKNKVDNLHSLSCRKNATSEASGTLGAGGVSTS